MSTKERLQKKIASKREIEADMEHAKRVVKPDALDEDPSVPGQAYVCMSFLNPERILQKKEVFFFDRFLKTWDFNKSVETFIQFLNYISFKFNLSFDDLTGEFKDFMGTEREKILLAGVKEDYASFMDKNEDKLTDDFNIAHKFQTSARACKVKGVYSTFEEASVKAEEFRDANDAHNVFVGDVGKWMYSNPNPNQIGDSVYTENELNNLMTEKISNELHAKKEFDKRLMDTRRKAIEDNIKSSEKTGNMLTQTIDASGNLVGVGNTTQDIDMASKGDELTVDDIKATLFESDNIITGETDHGLSIVGDALAPSKAKGMRVGSDTF
jgi:hypothetical protein